jgi:hypothetical protein
MNEELIVQEHKVKNNYIDNERFLYLLKECPSNKEISDELGEAFCLIAKNVAYSRQFINYSESWKCEMVSDALYNCCRYVKTFNPEKGKNAFAYFTGVVRNAFINRIKIEKFKSVKDDIIREEVYNDFLNEYRLIAGTPISQTEDCEFIEKSEVVMDAD